MFLKLHGFHELSDVRSFQLHCNALHWCCGIKVTIVTVCSVQSIFTVFHLRAGGSRTPCARLHLDPRGTMTQRGPAHFPKTKQIVMDDDLCIVHDTLLE